ncbi:hypothetical protein Ahy_B08g092228 isoform C [Arachis hypogaea]|uniref:Uncharacterized protein n=1 Tax=Arachis hypogaea TaxID=3818 RepID=A0A444Y3M2_ARAHY|nr:hypothetical protein Ahy_B08g092228 isoform C [Arachis hypogaea]
MTEQSNIPLFHRRATLRQPEAAVAAGLASTEHPTSPISVTHVHRTHEHVRFLPALFDFPSRSFSCRRLLGFACFNNCVIKSQLRTISNLKVCAY